VKTRSIVVALALTAGVGFVAGRGFGGEEAPAPQQMKEMIRKLATPGPQHAELVKMAGDWTAQGTAQGEAGPAPMTGKASMKPILGGRFLVQEYDGEMMGERFQGYGVTGFDNHKKEWFTLWLDSMGTSWMSMAGPDPAEDAPLELEGTWDTPMGPIVFRQVLTFANDDEHKVEMWSTMGGAESKMMELTYTRAK